MLLGSGVTPPVPRSLATSVIHTLLHRLIAGTVLSPVPPIWSRTPRPPPVPRSSEPLSRSSSRSLLALLSLFPHLLTRINPSHHPPAPSFGNRRRFLRTTPHEPLAPLQPAATTLGSFRRSACVHSKTRMTCHQSQTSRHAIMFSTTHNILTLCSACGHEGIKLHAEALEDRSSFLNHLICMVLIFNLHDIDIPVCCPVHGLL